MKKIFLPIILLSLFVLVWCNTQIDETLGVTFDTPEWLTSNFVTESGYNPWQIEILADDKRIGLIQPTSSDLTEEEMSKMQNILRESWFEIISETKNWIIVQKPNGEDVFAYVVETDNGFIQCLTWPFYTNENRDDLKAVCESITSQ